MKTNNMTILNTFGISAEDFYFICLKGGYSPIDSLITEIEKYNAGNYSDDGSLPECPIDGDQKLLLAYELECAIDEIRNSNFRVLQLRSVPDKDNDENLNEVDSISVGEFKGTPIAIQFFNASEIAKNDDNYFGYEIVRIDEDGEIIGTAGNFIKGVVISEF